MKTASPIAAALLLLPTAQGFTAPLHSQLSSATSRRGIDVKRAPCSSRLSLSTAPAASSADSPYASPQLDTAALTKYSIAALTELSLFAASFASLDLISSALLGASLPTPLTAFLFYAISLKSRVFNPLNNARPDRSKATAGKSSAGFRDRIMPKWTPPGVVFPIMWLLIIGPLRAYSSALVVHSLGGFLTVPTMAFILHLTLGDVWNTINNAERRYGASVVGVLMVLASAVNASIQYGSVLPLAGKLLGVTCIWLTVATTLITDTWRLNPVDVGGASRRVPLYPVKGEAETGFLWFGGSEATGDGDDTSSAGGPGCKQLVNYDKVDAAVAEEKVTYRNRSHLLKSKGISEK